jgi:hypothetical protein
MSTISASATYQRIGRPRRSAISDRRFVYLVHPRGGLARHLLLVAQR